MNGKKHKTTMRPAMLYGLEMVSMTYKMKRELEAADMKMLQWTQKR